MSSIPLKHTAKLDALLFYSDTEFPEVYLPLAHLPALAAGSAELPGVQACDADFFIFDETGLETNEVLVNLEATEADNEYEGCKEGTILATFRPTGTDLNFITTKNKQFFDAQVISQSVMEYCHRVNPAAFTKREARHGLFKIIETELLRTEPFDQAGHDALNEELK